MFFYAALFNAVLKQHFLQLTLANVENNEKYQNTIRVFILGHSKYCTKYKNKASDNEALPYLKKVFKKCVFVSTPKFEDINTTLENKHPIF